MAERIAACHCGEISLTVRGNPEVVSMCHCLSCQRRSGSVCSVQGYFSKSQVTIKGSTKRYSRPGDSGRMVDFHFCPTCGSTSYWHVEPWPDKMGIPIGTFADPSFIKSPNVSIFVTHRHSWVVIPEGIPQTAGHSKKFNEDAERALADLRKR